ncbi:molybdopterin cofactor-binding domain-containing protein [Treponema sp.]|uniref:molybdopterin cofactor-binding domain-containing protein n=1 Tax=Treponema sp. TaxID=166 RepID=UPI003EFF8289
MSRNSSARKNSQISFQKEFYSDLTMDNMYFAVVVRSPVREGIIKSISHPDLPDGYSLITARDVPGSNLVNTIQGKLPVFCEGNISYEGEPLALLAGPSESVLKSLLDELVLTIDTNTIEDYLPDEFDINSQNIENPEKKKTKKEIKIQNEELQNLKEIKEKFFSDKLAQRIIKFGPCFEKGDGEKNMEKLFAESKYVIENEWSYALKLHDYGEPNGAMCSWKDNSVTISTPTQWLNNLRHIASEALAIPMESITIRKTTSTNRGTNSIWYNSIIACQTAVASKKTGHPVKLVYTREEQEKFLNKMQPISIRHKTAVNEKGIIEAMQIQIEMDAGFNNPFAQEIIDRLSIASCGCYNPKNIFITATAHSSLNSASSVDIQLIDSAAFFAVENQMNEVCSKCNLTPLEFRLKNHINIDFTKRKIPNVQFLFEIEKFSETIEALSKASDFNRKYASYRLDAMNWKLGSGPKEYVSVFSSPMRGIGFSCAFEGAGYYGDEIYNGTHSLEVTLETESVLTIHCPPVSDSVQEIWKEIASEILGSSVLSVRINSVFSSGEEPLLPENVYSNISIMTSLLKKCCLAIKRRKPGSPLPFKVKRKTAAVKKTEWCNDTLSGRPFHSTSFAAAAIELEINPCTYREKIRSIALVLNGGKILNIQAATSTVKLGIQKVLSSLLEDDKVECKNIRISFMQSEKDPSQIGELVHQVIPAAYTQALTQALNCTINSLPLKTDSLFIKIKEQKARIKAMKEMEAALEQKAQQELEENKIENSAISEQ